VLGVRTPEVVLSVLFPLLVAVGIALGIDAVTATEFWYAKLAFAFAAALIMGVTLWWFYREPLTPAVGVMVFFLTGSIGTALFGGLKWLDLKENVYCVVLPSWHFENVGDGPWPLVINVRGIFPAIDVKLSIREVHAGPTAYLIQKNIGDVEPSAAYPLDDDGIPSLPAGIYQINLHMRSGNFVEDLLFDKKEDRLIMRFQIWRIFFENNQLHKVLIEEGE
jgi:hypothetical protein